MVLRSSVLAICSCFDHVSNDGMHERREALRHWQLPSSHSIIQLGRFVSCDVCNIVVLVPVECRQFRFSTIAIL